MDFKKVYGLFDPEENNLSLEIWIESDGKVLLDQLKKIENTHLSEAVMGHKFQTIWKNTT